MANTIYFAKFHSLPTTISSHLFSSENDSFLEYTVPPEKGPSPTSLTERHLDRGERMHALQAVERDGVMLSKHVGEGETGGESPRQQGDHYVLEQCHSHPLRAPLAPLPPGAYPAKLLAQVFMRERLFCGNRCLCIPDPGVLVCTVILLITPAVVFYQTVIPCLPPQTQLPAGCGFGFLLAGALGTLVSVAFSDPGILPRNRCPAEIPVGPSRVKFVVINGISVPQKWCTTCCLYRPPRTKHCSVCNTCVRRFDHHCPWVSNCIGQRNYRVFFFFVLFCALYALAGAIAAGVTLSVQIQNWGMGFSGAAIWRAGKECPQLAGLFVYSVCAAIPLVHLFFFNVYLVANNLTTNEEVLQLFSERNPYSSGCAANLYYFLSHPVEPRYPITLSPRLFPY
ncbi:DHHC zinc finger domain-containing protein [Besnoitia besnoiti]|uniref:Palmitoyltransferase n=1 Tax=Besnoitia besnoiti TaxID=94643 RepID=A0A2A9MBU6_BESBE|nr:DHHC zinc finger domain-containing protein [Besnoitia besnoiti]PFH35339.1 DHHC zinc finger domain-containing protein [Besnoitia besnoiti]